MSIGCYSVRDRVVVYSETFREWCAGIVIDIYLDRSVLVLFYINHSLARKRIRANCYTVQPYGATTRDAPHHYFRSFIKGGEDEAWRLLREEMFPLCRTRDFRGVDVVSS